MSDVPRSGPTTLWTCAFAHADELVEWFGAQDQAMWGRMPRDLVDEITVLLTCAIAGQAAEQGITVTQPSDLDDIALSAVHAARLDEVWMATRVATATGPVPAAGEPGRDAYRRIQDLAGDRQRRDEWRRTLGAAATVALKHVLAAGTSGSLTPTLGQRRNAPPAHLATGASVAARPPGPDALRAIFPHEMLERLARMNAAAFGMVVAYLDGDAAELAAQAQIVGTVDDDQARAGLPWTGEWTGTRYSFATQETLRLVGVWLDVADHAGGPAVTPAEVLDGARELITRWVPEQHRQDALGVADRLPSDNGPVRGFPVQTDHAGLGELYCATAIAGWLAISGRVSPSRETVRTYLIKRIRGYHATALGVPESERIVEISDEHAFEVLDSLLGDVGGRAAIVRDPRQRTVVDMDVLAMAKAHLLEHPERTPESDRVLLDGILRVITGPAPDRPVPTASPGMTETERRRADKLAAREHARHHARGGKGSNTGKGSAARAFANGGGGTVPTVAVVPGMAADVPLPSQDDPTGRAAYAQRVLDQALHGTLFLLNYLAFIADGGFDVPLEHFAPRREDESAEEYGTRRQAARKLVEVQAAAGSWAELCVDELRETRPSDAAGVATFILTQGFDWCRESGFEPTAAGFRDGAPPLLDALCPAQYRDQAHQVLDTFCAEIMLRRPPSIEDTAARHPIATIHVAAAMTGWLFSEPACVPDRASAQLKLADQGMNYADPTGQHRQNR